MTLAARQLAARQVGRTAASRAGRRRQQGGSDAAAWAGLALPAGLAALSVAALAWQSVDPEPASFAGATVDRLSAVLTLLVAGVGAATYRFSVHYLDGDPRRGRFLGWLAFTVACAYLLMLSTNLLLLFAAWSLTSLGLHRLLTHYPDRPEAVRAARKKFLISRLGDAALLGAIGVAWFGWGTLDLRLLAADPDGGPVTALSLLAVLAALTKSAQVPFHSWLPETMESPTPVSALMHAGVINAGGALLLRFSPLLVQVPSALLVLAVVGTLTAALGVVAMWAQVKVKRTLAWSTVSQMGFMMVQCGVGAFGAAALHIVAHGLYKAWQFLRSGGLPAAGGAKAAVPPGRALGLGLAGTVAGAAAAWPAAWVTGFDPLHTPGEVALSAVVALSAGQLWVALLGPVAGGGLLRRIALTVVGTMIGVVAAFALYRGAGLFLAPVLGAPAATLSATPIGPLAWAAAAVPVVVFTGLVVAHALLPAMGRTRAGRAFRVHALHGFYGGAAADRVVAGIYGRLPGGRTERV